MKTGVELIAIERQEQIEKHGFNAIHDVMHNDGAIHQMVTVMLSERHTHVDVPNGWERFYEKQRRKPYKERLIIAGALLAAEIDRLSNNS